MRKLALLASAVLMLMAPASAMAYHHHGRRHHAHTQRHLAIRHHRAHKADVEEEEPSWAEWQQECLAEGPEPEWCVATRQAGEVADAEEPEA